MVTFQASFLLEMKGLVLVFIFFLSVQVNAQPGTSFYINSTIGGAEMQFDATSIYTYTNYSKFIKSDYSGNVSWTRTLNIIKWVVDDNSIYVINSQNILSRIDSSGLLIWSFNLPAVLCYGYVYDMVPHQGKLFLVYGNQGMSSSNGLIVIDSTGAIINSWCDYSGDDVSIDRVFPSTDGGVWISYRLGPGAVGYELSLVKTHSNGDLDTLSVTPFFNNFQYNNVIDMLQLRDSTLIAINMGHQQSGTANIGIKKIQPSGATLWEKLITSYDTSFILSTAGFDSLNNLYLTGSSSESWGDYLFEFAMKIDPSGNLLFAKKWSVPNSLRLTGFTNMGYQNNSLYIPAYFKIGTNTYPATIALDNLLSASCFFSDSIISIAESIPANVYDAQRSFTNTSVNLTAATTIYNSTGNPVHTDLCFALGTFTPQYSKELSIANNPVNQFVDVQFHNPQREQAKITLFNVLGEMVFEGNSIEDKISFDLSGLSNGIYTFRIVMQNETYTGSVAKQ